MLPSFNLSRAVGGEHETVKLVQYVILDYLVQASALQFFTWFRAKQILNYHHENVIITRD